MSSARIAVDLAVQPWFFDHGFGGKSVFPAVETILLLASGVVQQYPEVDIRCMENASFSKFLEIPPESTTLPVLIESELDDRDRIQVKLLSRVQLKTMSRVIEHGRMSFLFTSNLQPADIDPAPLADPIMKISAEQVYSELVPFGSAYQTLAGTLYLGERSAWGQLQAPEFQATLPVQKIMGSPFSLDGAMHAACVLGQQVVDFVPFPVGFSRRMIVRPTQPGEQYITRVELRSQKTDELCFDLGIFDEDGQVYETVTGVRMRAVGI